MIPVPGEVPGDDLIGSLFPEEPLIQEDRDYIPEEPRDYIPEEHRDDVPEEQLIRPRDGPRRRTTYRNTNAAS